MSWPNIFLPVTKVKANVIACMRKIASTGNQIHKQKHGKTATQEAIRTLGKRYEAEKMPSDGRLNI